MTGTKLRLALPKELTELVRQAVKSGQYESDTDVVSEALREWKLRRLDPREKKELLRLWREGLESGPGRLGSIDRWHTAAVRTRLNATYGSSAAHGARHLPSLF